MPPQPFCSIYIVRTNLGLVYTLSRSGTESGAHCKDIIPQIRNKYSQKRILRGLSPNFHIHVSARDFYIPAMGPPILLRENMWTDPGNIYKPLTQTHECGNWDWGRAIPFLGIHKWDFCGSATIPLIVVPCSQSGLTCRWCSPLRTGTCWVGPWSTSPGHASSRACGSPAGTGSNDRKSWS